MSVTRASAGAGVSSSITLTRRLQAAAHPPQKYAHVGPPKLLPLLPCYANTGAFDPRCRASGLAVVGQPSFVKSCRLYSPAMAEVPRAVCDVQDSVLLMLGG